MAPAPPRKVSHTEWLEDGKRLFGEDWDSWKFVCPNCGTIQSIGEFRALKKKGIDVQPSTAAQCCIGRFDPGLDKVKGNIGNAQKPCDYTINGLLVFAKTIVIHDNGKEQPVFEFAKEG